MFTPSSRYNERSGIPSMTQVTVWNEFRHERTDPNVMAVYPYGIHITLAEGLARKGDRA